MCAILISLLKNEDGFTVVEYGLFATLIFIALAQMITAL